ncbi:response regulator [Solemya velesiana gill symbiont]|uniref:DNA-binding response regulator n=1 Tax=Solemya velesiana gill symbiont TaxID=1918948 RepID=A0A1T2KXD9_9GAMM|nr:response regulator transcription factor [Solemya velesiana gill symbiont]OOZ37515.1 DNA-binding response regulator [Solemya velesiana gill symbiont]
MKKIHVLIADDHAIVRQGLKAILDYTDDLVVAGEAADGHEVIKKLREGHWDVLLLDIAMPGMAGIEALNRVRAENKKLPVLILSIYPPEQYAIRLLKSGASGYMTKESAPEQLVMAIRMIAEGRKYISPEVGELLNEQLLGDSEQSLHESLSNREYQVFCRIASGETVGEIAESLSLSVKTISTYRSRILEKLHVKNNAELTYYAFKHGLVM